MYPDKFTTLLENLGAARSCPRFRDALADGGFGPEVLRLPAGVMRMGGDSGENDEHPAHPVSLASFAISRSPLTFAAYDRFVAGVEGVIVEEKSWWPAGLPMPGGRRRRVDLPRDNGWGRGERPVIHVSWYDALGYAEWLSAQTGRHYRLPTEAEWEYAARAGTQSVYSCGDDPLLLQDHAWFADNARGRTWPVGRKRPNPWGLHDMHGNVWEWTASAYSPRYEGLEQRCLQRDAGDESLIAVRGGSWLNKAPWLRSALRYWYAPGYRSAYLGFRLVCA